ncbi:glutamine cyclotransferase [Corynebacterium aquilae DSM 44791]|uniref:Glutamine cyclotransferase n=1 Tax=Corynebacterium aquilae DSM 44791 TaxID=1431546 RepID=A0A1L7CEN5_9CORY|nr:glutamine cyclotransferase [Corynebacterium aquilae DSM 44791]
MSRAVVACCAVVGLVASGCTQTAEGPDPNLVPERLTTTVVKTHPFDPTSFTQGLELDGDRLWVSTGWHGQSGVYATSLEDPAHHGQPQARLEDKYFGEGITQVGDTLWQLTWRQGTAFKRDAATLDVVQTASYSGEGWGLCSFDKDDSVMVMSDGTNQLRLIDPESFVEDSRVMVQSQGQEIDKLNELDCTVEKGRRVVYANRYLTTDIYRIDLDTGTVTAVIDASNLKSNAAPDRNNVLNGIAHIPGSDRFLLAGKRWPQMYEVRFTSAG